MKRVKFLKGLIILAAFVSIAAIASCGGGGGGSDNWNGGSESNPTATLVDASGNAVTSISPNSPIIGKATGLLANGVYQVSILQPDGTALYDENLILVTDNGGNISDSILAYLGNDAGGQGAAMVLDVDDDGNDVVRVNYKAITPGAYTAHFCKESETTCDATTASSSVTVTVAGTDPYVFTTDSASGTDGVRSFANGVGDVYGVVRNGPANSATLNLRVVANSFQTFSNGDPLPTAVTGTADVNCPTDANGDCGPVLLWTDASATLDGQAATFDIVADVDGDGNWTAGTDFMDAEGYVPGFVIQNTSLPTSPNIAAITVDGTNNVAEVACSKAGSAYCTHSQIYDGIDVYGYINPPVRSSFPHNLAYKYIILHSDSLADGDALTPIQSFGYDHAVDPLQWGCTNEGRILLWPAATHVAGCYDVVLDVNKNDVYDAGVDIIDGYSGVCGFIIPGAEGAPTVTINTITDGDGVEVASGGSTTSNTAYFNFTATLDEGSSFASCQIRWAVGDSSNTADIDVTALASGEPMDTQPISLFAGNNTVILTCVDDGNLAGSSNVTVESSNTATADIYFQSTLNWQGPSSSSTTSFDMDLHVVEPGGTYQTATDCYYANCKENAGYTTTTGMFLNVDCISQCKGPENIWLPQSATLQSGTYKVCVDPFSGEGTQLQVSIYDKNKNLIETVGRSILNDSTGDWYVGNFNCSGASCTWSRVDTVSTTNPCQ